MGSILLLFSGTCVYIGVRFVSRLAPVALVCVLFSILSIYIGEFWEGGKEEEEEEEEEEEKRREKRRMQSRKEM